jgi:ribosomal protein L11 methyltransferase
MTWWAVDVQSDAARRERLAAWLVGQTGQAVEERGDGVLVGFATGEAAASAIRDALEATFPGQVSTTVREVAEVDWSSRWRDGLGRRDIGPITLTPTWLATDLADRPTVVLDPETAFGTGEHGSTRSALALMIELLRPGDLVLDLGSGSGILAIAAAKLGARQAVGIDSDPEAIAVAGRNAARNGVADRVGFVEGDAAALAPLCGPADLVVSNILPTVNASLLPAIRAALRPGGHAVFAGMEAFDGDRFRRLLSAAVLTPIQECQDEGWWAIAARR